MERFSPRQLAAASLAAFVILVVAGLVLRHAAPAEAHAPPAATFRAPTAHQIDAGSFVVDVSGAVRRPGVYELPPDARVAAAIQRAGGFARDADLSSVNRASKIVDGQQIVVGRAIAGASAVASSGSSAPASVVSINAATVEQFDELDGVGPTTAQKIVDDRSTNGPFATIDELDRVPGIGPGTIDRLRERLTL